MTEEIKIKTKMKAISYSLQWQKLESENSKYNRDLYQWEALSVGIRTEVAILRTIAPYLVTCGCL